MNKLKKAIALCSAIFLCSLGAGFLSACNETGTSQSSSSSSSGSVDTDTSSSVYKVYVQHPDGFPLSGVSVSLYDGNDRIATSTVSAAGYAAFKNDQVPTVGNYDVVIEELPKGYALEEGVEHKTIALAGTTTTVNLYPTGVLEGAAPLGTTYDLGDVVYDFSVTLSDGSTFTLSEELKEKDMVLLNFWATWCDPCKAEFPYMNNAYIAYQDNISILGMSTTDGKNDVASFKSSAGLNFDMCHSQANLTTMFEVAGIPHTVIIDRYGVMAYEHVGNMTTLADFTNLFDFFVGETYEPTVIGSYAGVDPEEGEDGSSEMIKPNVDAPSFTDVKTALNSGDAFTYHWDDTDEYSWPWLTSESKDYIYAPNKNVHNSYAQIYATFTVTEKDTVLAFDYLLGSEEKSDMLYILIDDVIVKQISGYHLDDWNTCYANVFRDWEVGEEHELTLIYQKDESNSAGDDTACIKNLRFEKLSAVENEDMGYVFRNAAETPTNSKNAKTQFEYYVTPVYSDPKDGGDGYYHVNSADGPILLANLWYSSPWSETSVWMLAYYGYCVEDGLNYVDSIEAFAWEANNNMENVGYTPVTEELRYLLDLTVRNVTDYQLWDGKYHENEWLELCCYYQHYGTTDPYEDPMKTITFHAAEELSLGSNNIEILFAINPRGFKYKFTPDNSGVYHFYTTGKKDTLCWLVDEDTTTFLGYWDNDPFAETYIDENGVEVANGNLDFHYYLEAGKTYYLLCSTYLDQTGNYNLEIEYVGDTYTYFANAASGMYSYNLVTNELYLPTAIQYAYSDPKQGGDGYYHYVNEDGTLGSIIYLDVNRTTYFFERSTVYRICADALRLDETDADGDGITDEYFYAEEDRAFYVNGVDYSKELLIYCLQGMVNEGDLEGFVAVDARLLEILQDITINKYEGIEESWLLLCYYQDTLTANDF